MTDYHAAVGRRAPAIARSAQGDLRGTGWVIGYTEEPQVLIEHADGSREWWLARLTDILPDTPAQAAQDRPRRDETPADGGTDGSAAPDASQGRTCDHHADTLDHIRGARTLGGHAGIAEGLAAIAHAILHGQERP